MTNLKINKTEAREVRKYIQNKDFEPNTQTRACAYIKTKRERTGIEKESRTKVLINSVVVND